MMWFACEGGLNRYDGKSFKILRPDERYQRLLNENIETLFIDSRENLWVGTKSGGISVYYQASDEFINLNEQIIAKKGAHVIRITEIIEDRDRDIWVGTWGLGLLKFSADNYQLTATYFNNNIIHDLELDSFNNLWVAPGNQLFKYSVDESRFIDTGIKVGVCQSLLYDSISEKLLIGSSKGLFEYDINTNEITEFAGSTRLGLRDLNTVNIDKKGRIWVGSWNQGMYVSSQDRTSFKKFNLIPGQPNNTNYETVLDIYIDDDGLIWVATGYGGVVKLSPKKSITHIINKFDNAINLPENNIQSIAKDSKGALWCGTWGGGIGYSKNLRSFEQLPGVEKGKVSCFLQLGDKMLAGTAWGLKFYDINSPQQGPIKKIYERDKVKSIYLDQAKRLWVGTQQNGLLLVSYEDHGDQLKTNLIESFSLKSGSLESDRISQIIEDDQGNIWVGTYNGLYLLNPADTTFTRVEAIKGQQLPSVIVLSILPTSEGEIWLGMPGGLLKTQWNGKNLEIVKVFNSSMGLKNDYITAITIDPEQNIWLSNAAGIATVRKENDNIINLLGNQTDSYSMNINSCYNDGTRIFFGSASGLFYFDPLQVELSSEPPNLIFNQLKIDNKEVAVGQKINDRVILKNAITHTDAIELSYKESVASLGFIPDQFQNRENLTYYYRLVGLQDNWINNGNSSEVNFIGLDAGYFNLEVKCTWDNVHFSDISSMKILVSPPPWLSAWAYTIYAIIIIVLGFLINQFLVNRTKLEAKLAMAKLSEQKEHELTEAKLQFFTNVSHELRTPLTLITSPVSEILSDHKLAAELREKLTYIERNASKLLDLINQLIDFRKADQNELKLRVATGNFAPFFEEIFLSFKGYAETRGVHYDFQSETPDLQLTYDRDKMEVVICNLLSNAFKFTPKDGQINVSLKEDSDNCIITISDTGKGISKEYQEKIFNRFFQIRDSDSAKMVGSGIGLSLSQKIVELHHGEITVSSELEKGTTFTITIPKGFKHFEPETILQDFVHSEDINKYEPTAEIEDNEREESPLDETKINLLIIDDNKDIQTYLKTLFAGQGYHVTVAENGLEGKDIALEEVPDLIISDVMMPEMDGLELCKLLKNDIRTSHIPIILLTARTSTVHEVDGLDLGADDYVRKPFDTNVIKSRVATLLENREKVRNHLLNKVRFEPNTTNPIVDKEEKFIQDISEMIEKNMLNAEFGIESMSDDLCMSQSTLYRKIKSITGLSIAGFIRSIRLKKAAEMLISEDTKLSAIAYSVGFNDYKYFKRSFTEQFGLSPKTYRENRIEELKSELHK